MKTPSAIPPNMSGTAKVNAAPVLKAGAPQQLELPASSVKATTDSKALVLPESATQASPTYAPAQTTVMAKAAQPVSAAPPTQPKAREKRTSSPLPSQVAIHRSGEAAEFQVEKPNFAP